MPEPVSIPRRLIVLLLLLLLVVSPAAARHESVLKIDVDLVLVNAAVTDRSGRPVTGLKKADFQLWEDKVPQDILYFSSEEIPVSLAVVFDVSGSMADKLSVSRDAVRKFLQTGGPRDEYALIEFNSRPEVTREFTLDSAAFQNQLALASSSGYTALYDAVYLGIERLRHAHNQRKALLLVTDGEDNHSHYTFNDIKELAKESDIQLFAIGISGYPALRLGSSTIDARKGSHKPGQDALQELVDLVGGQSFFTADARNLDGICAKISESLRNEYVIGYAPTNAARNGQWRKLRLKVNELSHATVHARSGYYAPMQ
jgi:Ca-activated chloride channel family protein